MSTPISRPGVAPSILLGTASAAEASDATTSTPPEKQGAANPPVATASKVTVTGARSSTFERLNLSRNHVQDAHAYAELRIGRAEQRLRLWRKEMDAKECGDGSRVDTPVLRLSGLQLTSADLDKFMDRNGDAMQQVNILYLNDNAIETLPRSVCRLSNLAFLNLDGNSMFELPPEIGDMSGLTHLHLSGNLLVGLPDQLGELANLAELYLYENALTGLPESIGNLSRLEVLDVGRNAITALPDGIGMLRKLGVLLASQNDIAALPAWWNEFKEQTGLYADLAQQCEGFAGSVVQDIGPDSRNA